MWKHKNMIVKLKHEIERAKPIFGLYPVAGPGPSQKAHKPLPLQKIDIKTHIKGSVAKTELAQTFFNDTKDFLEVEYYFPIPYNACFDSFKASFEGTVIEGIIKEKREAKKEYLENFTEGNTTAYAEITEAAGDIMKVLIGNIPPSTAVQISFSYLQQLEVIRNQFYRFAFHSEINPARTGFSDRRFNLPGKKMIKNDDLQLLCQYPQLPEKKGSFWNIEATVECSSPVAYLECTPHKTEIKEIDNPCKKKIQLALPLKGLCLIRTLCSSTARKILTSQPNELPRMRLDIAR